MSEDGFRSGAPGKARFHGALGQANIFRRSGRARFALFWALPPVIWQALFFIGPLAFLIAMSFWSVKSYRLTPDFVTSNWVHIFRSNFFFSTYIYTFAMASLTAALASVLAFPAAYTLAFNVSAGTRRMLMFLLIVPFFTSYPIRIYSWQIFFSPSGIINRLLNSFGAESISILDTSAATLIGYLTLTLPLVILVQTFALVNVDQRLLEAAHNLGCNRWRTILTVLIPSARVGLTLAATFAFILSFGDYISPMFLGGSKPPTLSILITDQVKSGNHWPRASVVAVTMVITLVLVLLAATAIAYPRARRST